MTQWLGTVVSPCAVTTGRPCILELPALDGLFAQATVGCMGGHEMCFSGRLAGWQNLQNTQGLVNSEKQNLV